MALDPADLPGPVLAFLRERHLATLTTLRPDGTPHVVPVGFTYEPDARRARVITGGDSRKARNVRGHDGPSGGPADGARPASSARRAALCQVDGPRWVTLEGVADVDDDPDAVAHAEALYAVRYRVPRENPRRVVLTLTVDRVLGRA